MLYPRLPQPHIGGMDSYKIVRGTGRYIVLITHADGTRSWSRWFASRVQAETWVVEQTLSKELQGGLSH
jgi:hypothetical protein